MKGYINKCLEHLERTSEAALST